MSGAPAPFIASKSDFITVDSAPGLSRRAVQLGELVDSHSQRPGAHNTPAAEVYADPGEQARRNRRSHIIGKHGELVFEKWANMTGLAIEHHPFRDNYERRVEFDDFIVNSIRIEIKTKMRGPSSASPPNLDYNVNPGVLSLADDALFIFIELPGSATLGTDMSAFILGWGTSASIAKFGSRRRPGDWSENKRWQFGRHDWDLRISQLYRPRLLESTIRDAQLPPGVEAASRLLSVRG